VYLEFLFYWVPKGHSFQPSDVAAMAKLSLRIAPNDVVVDNPGHPVVLLFLGALLAYCCDWVTRDLSV
jgi:hypothetical protein